VKLACLLSGPEIFLTLQGEGPTAGSPAIFIRSALCNLHCRWCDSDHTWNFTGTPWPHDKDNTPGYAKHRREDVLIELEPQDIAERILAFDCSRLVLTGGEPLLQQAEWPELLDLIRRRRPETCVEVETNGTIAPEAAFDQRIDHYNVSPKLANSGMAADLRLKPEPLSFFARCLKAWFKFVVAEPDDLDEIDALAGRFELPPERLILMPEGRSVADLDRRAAWLAPICRDRGFRFGDRLHIRLWGDQPGT
jgi:organic radical activating enzyme